MGERISKTWSLPRLTSDIGRCLLLLLAVMLFPAKSYANQGFQGMCADGGVLVQTVGISSTNAVQGSFPGCTVTVNIHGGGLATIFRDNLGTGLANPFTASATDGSFLFYAANGRYDITVTAVGLNYTYSDVLLNDSLGSTSTAAVFIPTTRADRQAILQNPDFEGSSVIPPPGWNLNNGSSQTVSYETIAPAPGKKQSIKIATTANTSQGLVTQTVYSSFPGDTYALTLMAKGDGSSSAAAEIAFFDKNGSFVNFAAFVSTASTSWTQLTGFGTVPANGVEMQVVLLNGSATQPSSVWFDQVEVRQTNFVGPLYTVNGTATTPGFSFFQNQNYGLYFESGVGPVITFAGADSAGFTSSSIKETSAGVYTWTSSGGALTAVSDTGLSRISAAAVGVGNGTQGDLSGTIQANHGFFGGATGGNAVEIAGGAQAALIHQTGTGAGNGQLWSFALQNAGNSDLYQFGASSSTYTTGGLVGWLGNTNAFIYHSTQNFLIGAGTTANTAINFDSTGNTVRFPTLGVLGFTSGGPSAALDSAFSRSAAGVINVGNGTQADASGTIKATTHLGVSAILGRSGIFSGEQNGNTLFFGHTNTQYVAAIGANNTSGLPYLDFYAYQAAGTNQHDYASSTNLPMRFTVNDTVSPSGAFIIQGAPSGTVDTAITFSNMYTFLNTGAGANPTVVLGTAQDAGLTRIGAGILAVGNGTAGDFTGTIRVGNGSASTPSYAFGSDTATGMYRVASGDVDFTSGGADSMLLGNSVARLGNAYVLGWSSNVNPTAAGTDTAFSRLAADSVALGNGTAGDFSGTLKDTITNAVTGYQVNGTATNGHCLVGNGTNYVDNVCSTIAGGIQAQVFTSSGTFTIPVGTANVKVTVVAGGGAGGGATNTQSGSGGAAGGASIKWLTGLTPGNTLTVTVGGGGVGASGAVGGNGVASSVSSGTQTITTISTTPGNGGTITTTTAQGGSGGSAGSGGDVNFGGSMGGITTGGVGGSGAGSIFGGGGDAVSVTAGKAPGAGGGGQNSGVTATGANGAAGIVIFEWVH